MSLTDLKHLGGAVLSRLFRRRRYKLHRGVALRGRRDLIQIAPGAQLYDYVIVYVGNHPVKIGRDTQINSFSMIFGGSGVTIGDHVMIAPHCVLAAGNHDYRQADVPMRLAGAVSQGPIVIEDNVWIGANCTITDGVRIGAGAVVGANSVVTRDVGANQIVAGVPARVIGDRRDFSDPGDQGDAQRWHDKRIDTRRVA